MREKCGADRGAVPGEPGGLRILLFLRTKACSTFTLLSRRLAGLTEAAARSVGTPIMFPAGRTDTPRGSDRAVSLGAPSLRVAFHTIAVKWPCPSEPKKREGGRGHKIKRTARERQQAPSPFVPLFTSSTNWPVGLKPISLYQSVILADAAWPRPSSPARRSRRVGKDARSASLGGPPPRRSSSSGTPWALCNRCVLQGLRLHCGEALRRRARSGGRGRCCRRLRCLDGAGGVAQHEVNRLVCLVQQHLVAPGL